MVSSTGLAQPSASRATASVSSPAGMVSDSSRLPMPRRSSRIRVRMTDETGFTYGQYCPIS